MNLANPLSARVNIWPLVAFLGLVNLVIALLAIFWPGATLTVVVFIFGVQLLLIGALRIIVALMLPDAEARWLGFFFGVLGIVVGLLVMREPLRSLEVLVILLGILWIVWGLIGLLSGIAAPPGSRAGWIIDGIASLAAGAVLMSWPDITLRVFTLVLGIGLLFVGGAQLYAAYQARHLRLEVDTPM
jgi:uncharacterized membrane protein HdeD (DUF308 family)